MAQTIDFNIDQPLHLQLKGIEDKKKALPPGEELHLYAPYKDPKSKLIDERVIKAIMRHYGIAHYFEARMPLSRQPGQPVPPPPPGVNWKGTHDIDEAFLHYSLEEVGKTAKDFNTKHRWKFVTAIIGFVLLPFLSGGAGAALLASGVLTTLLAGGALSAIVALPFGLMAYVVVIAAVTVGAIIGTIGMLITHFARKRVLRRLENQDSEIEQAKDYIDRAKDVSNRVEELNTLVQAEVANLHANTTQLLAKIEEQRKLFPTDEALGKKLDGYKAALEKINSEVTVETVSLAFHQRIDKHLRNAALAEFPKTVLKELLNAAVTKQTEVEQAIQDFNHNQLEPIMSRSFPEIEKLVADSRLPSEQQAFLQQDIQNRKQGLMDLFAELISSGTPFEILKQTMTESIEQIKKEIADNIVKARANLILEDSRVELAYDASVNGFISMWLSTLGKELPPSPVDLTPELRVAYHAAKRVYVASVCTVFRDVKKSLQDLLASRQDRDKQKAERRAILEANILPLSTGNFLQHREHLVEGEVKIASEFVTEKMQRVGASKLDEEAHKLIGAAQERITQAAQAVLDAVDKPAEVKEAGKVSDVKVLERTGLFPLEAQQPALAPYCIVIKSKDGRRDHTRPFPHGGSEPTVPNLMQEAASILKQGSIALTKGIQEFIPELIGIHWSTDPELDLLPYNSFVFFAYMDELTDAEFFFGQLETMLGNDGIKAMKSLHLIDYCDENTWKAKSGKEWTIEKAREAVRVNVATQLEARYGCKVNIIIDPVIHHRKDSHLSLRPVS